MTNGEIGGQPAARWLLLIHQFPAKPAYQRVKIWRRLQALGAVAIKNAVYALPADDQTQEDFEWLLKEIGEGGGEALICEARLIDGLSDDQVRAMFNAARDVDYEESAREARALGQELRPEISPAARADLRAKLARLKARAAQTVAIDFFGANGREAVDGLLTALEARLMEEDAMEPDRTGLSSAIEGFDPLLGRVWVTRRGVHVDRIASAWLIRRFIDTDARFKFVPGKGYRPEDGELRFDMFEAEFTHEGDRCTFEVLLTKAGFKDPALTAIAEIVHDIDLKDAKFGREETSGIAHLVAGLASAQPDDATRIERGGALFDDLYEYFRRKRA
ncbi:MAG: chromate resistance protein [Alphaproteobacteria bacterium]|nr:chromate resistance protein [Alphaproteobacteria bacterium]